VTRDAERDPDLTPKIFGFVQDRVGSVLWTVEPNDESQTQEPTMFIRIIRINRRIATASAVAALIGTVGVVAAVGSDGSQATSFASEPTESGASVPAADITSTTAPDDGGGISAHTGGTSTRSTPTGSTPTGSAPSAGTPAATTAPDGPDTVVEANLAVEDGADELDEPAAPGVPGVVSGPDHVDPAPAAPNPGTTEMLNPVPKPQPPLPTIPSPTDLLPGTGGGTPDPTPHQGPGAFQATPLPGHLGTLSSGLTGCQLECVTTALLKSNGLNANVVLDVTANVPVHLEVEVTTTGTNSSKHFSKAGYGTAWEMSLSPLQPKTTYDLTMIVIDQAGYSRVFEHQFTTVDIIDGLAGNAQGCALHCITEGSVHTTDQFSTVRLHMATNTPARYDVWVSTSEPGTIGTAPILPIEAKVYENASPATHATFDVAGLQADTVYHVIARAEDGWGIDHQVGTFRTDQAPPVPITVTFEQIRVTYDGDKGALNRGELSFSWGFDGMAIGHRGEEKMHAPTDITLSSHNSRTFLLPADGWSLPWFGVAGAERDWDGLVEFCAAGTGVASAPHYMADCDTKTNVARTGGSFGEADLAGHLPCSYWGFTGAAASHTCVLLVTPDMGDDYAQFTALVRIDAP
jgi:hypothetical protein